MMKTIIKLTTISILMLSLAACGNLSKRDKSTIAGAGIGAVAGSVLSSGSALGTVGGAAVGGIIGNQVGK
ncbi:glycine zipper 2TM domain-containing protein [Gallibacterium salpingitidis]|uniref:Lipoprotein n=1 Tax=Gallibacterium salpingitidis TaxID=505341 RepID=A0A1A7NR46_9PAST|nr:lipoprotein [Gallibacterium salpingitidis]